MAADRSNIPSYSFSSQINFFFFNIKGTPIFNPSSSSQSSVNDQQNEPLAVKKEKSKRMDASAWGSFTGSFFQASDLQSPSETIVSTIQEGTFKS